MVEQTSQVKKESPEERKARIIAILSNQPVHFRMAVKGAVYGKTQLIGEAERQTEAGVEVVELVDGFAASLTLRQPNALGKRYRCLVCGTEVLNTRAPKEDEGKQGIVSCCGQDMAALEPRPLPSSD